MEDFSEVIAKHGGNVYSFVNKACCELEERGYEPTIVLLTKTDYKWFDIYAKFLYGENADITAFEGVFGVEIHRIKHLEKSVVY